MLYILQFIVFTFLTIVTLLIAFTKNIRKESKDKPGTNKITIYGYVMVCITTINIIGLFWNLNRQKENEIKSSFITEIFDDTISSISKQLINYNLIYNKQTNQITSRYIEGTSIIPNFQLDAQPTINNKAIAITSLALFNVSSHNFYNIKQNLFFLKIQGKQITNSQKGLTLIPPINEIPAGSAIGPVSTVLTETSNDNILYLKIEYDDENGNSVNPIRQLYAKHKTKDSNTQAKQIFNSDSFNLIKSYLINNHIW